MHMFLEMLNENFTEFSRIYHRRGSIKYNSAE